MYFPTFEEMQNRPNAKHCRYLRKTKENETFLHYFSVTYLQLSKSRKKSRLPFSKNSISIMNPHRKILSRTFYSTNQNTARLHRCFVID